jgi:hypothetical protein
MLNLRASLLVGLAEILRAASRHNEAQPVSAEAVQLYERKHNRWPPRQAENGPSRSSALSCGVEVLELDAGTLGRESPVDPTTGRLRAACHAATSRSSVARSASRRSRHCPASTANSSSVMFNQLPCLGVECSSSRSASRLASAGGNAAYSDAGVWVLGVVLDQHDPLGVGVVDIDQVLDGSAPSRCGCAGR